MKWPTATSSAFSFSLLSLSIPFLSVSISFFIPWSIVPIEQWIVIRHLDDHLFSDWFIHWISAVVLVAPVATTSTSLRASLHLSVESRFPNDPRLIQTLPGTSSKRLSAHKTKSTQNTSQQWQRWFLLSVRRRFPFTAVSCICLRQYWSNQCLHGVYQPAHAGANWHGINTIKLRTCRKSRRC